MKRYWRQVTLLFCAFAVVGAGCAQAEEGKGDVGLDTEHIFGFTEGTVIGEQGEKEFDFTLDSRFGKAGPYFAQDGGAEFYYTVTDNFRAEVEASWDYHGIQDVPGLADRSAANVGGASSELRFRILDRETSPIGLDLSLEPGYQRVDDVSGAQGQYYSLPITILIDRDLVPGIASVKVVEI